jgi:uncharacterized LabA/DUF88 family protein
MKDKIAIFFDAGYFDNVCRDFGLRVDSNKLSSKICSLLDSEIYRTYYYDCLPHQESPPNEENRKRISKKQSYFYTLNKLPHFEVRLGNLVKSSNPSKEFEQKGVDVLLSIDFVQLASRSNITKAAIVTGDSDFVPAIERAKMLGAQTYVFYAKTKKANIHDELFNICDDRIEMDEKFLKSAKL